MKYTKQEIRDNRAASRASTETALIRDIKLWYGGADPLDYVPDRVKDLARHLVRLDREEAEEAVRQRQVSMRKRWRDREKSRSKRRVRKK